MGIKLAWAGLALIVAVPKLVGMPNLEIAGAVIMVIGAVLICLDR